jgi:hypothetical protein
MTSTADAAAAAPSRSQDLVLARIHLRLGSLGLARAELEGMAGTGSLDADGLVDLAEARWRTGDLAGAGDAANAALAAGSEAVVAYVVAAEATAAVGRPAEARRLASRALELADLSVGDVFAGMPRASVWPIEPGESVTTEPLFAPSPAASTPMSGPADAASPAARGLWDDHAGLAADLPAAADALEAGRAALAAGDQEAAALQLSLALRLSAALAPAILDLIGDADGPVMDLLRGDSYRLVGHERDARVAFAHVAAIVLAIPAEPTPAPRTDPKETA